ncbi:MAG: alanine racemase, partial [Oceanospirillales bacterium]|nr:alanine racemase [Oceanospirillales bacterium]
TSLAGRVSMDMLTVDLTDLPHADVGSRVELWGRQLPVAEVARWSDTIAYTLLTGLTSRVPRCYD